MQKNWDYANGATLKGLVVYLIGTNWSLILHNKNTGAWLDVRNTTVTSTVLSATGLHDFLCARYNVISLNLHIHRNEYGTKFNIFHTLSYRNEAWSSRVTTKCMADSFTYPTGLHLIISMRQTPNPSGTNQIREEDPSGEWQRQGDTRWCHDLRFMELSDWSHHWCQTTRCRCRFLQIWANGSASRSVTRMVSTAMINGNIFLHLFFLFMAC